MGFLRKRRTHSDDASPDTPDPGESNPGGVVGYNPHRDDYLYWLTEEGYIIAQDVACQHEYIQASRCAHCGGELVVIAHLNRSGQGLSEMVAMCRACKMRFTFIFDISNAVYQAWWAAQLGDLYIQQHDGDPREPYSPA